jgi:hypothetical protein
MCGPRSRCYIEVTTALRGTSRPIHDPGTVSIVTEYRVFGFTRPLFLAQYLHCLSYCIKPCSSATRSCTRFSEKTYSTRCALPHGKITAVCVIHACSREYLMGLNTASDPFGPPYQFLPSMACMPTCSAIHFAERVERDMNALLALLGSSLHGGHIPREIMLCIKQLS